MTNDEAKQLLLERRALVQDLRGERDTLTVRTIEAQIRMIDQRLTGSRVR